MKPIRSRDELTALVARHAPTNACASAMREKRAVVLGGFAAPGTFPCWIVRVESKRGTIWYVAVDVDEENYRMRIRYLGSVPWQNWIGSSTGSRPLIDGDEPAKYAFLRMQAKRRKQ